LILGGGWPGHFPPQGAEVVVAMLADDGFVPTITPDCAALSKAARLYLVVPVITNDQIDPAHVQALTAAVRAGTGLAGHHGGLPASFHAQVQIRFLIRDEFITASRLPASRLPASRLPASRLPVSRLPASRRGRRRIHAFMTTRVHALVDATGRPILLKLTAGHPPWPRQTILRLGKLQPWPRNQDRSDPGKPGAVQSPTIIHKNVTQPDGISWQC